MYIQNTRSYYGSDGTQHAARGWFLLLVQPKDYSDIRPIRAIVRKVALTQFGHFMMGTARVNKKSLTVSGSYGSDGLPLSVSDDVYNKAIDVPVELIELWKKGDGWNGAGSEAPSMRQWAVDNIDRLYEKPGKVHLRSVRLRNNAGIDFPACYASAQLLDTDKGRLKTTGDRSLVTCKRCKKTG